MIRPAVPTAWSGGCCPVPVQNPRLSLNRKDFVTETECPTLPGLAPGSTAGPSLPHSSPISDREKPPLGTGTTCHALPLADLGSLMRIDEGGPIAGGQPLRFRAARTGRRVDGREGLQLFAELFAAVGCNHATGIPAERRCQGYGKASRPAATPPLLTPST